MVQFGFLSPELSHPFPRPQKAGAMGLPESEGNGGSRKGLFIWKSSERQIPCAAFPTSLVYLWAFPGKVLNGFVVLKTPSTKHPELQDFPPTFPNAASMPSCLPQSNQTPDI